MATMDIAHQLYYAKVLDLALRDLEMLVSVSNKAMENIQKEHMTKFHKWLPVYDALLGPWYL